MNGDKGSIDLSTKKNLEELVEIGKKLLDETVSRVNIDTGIFERVTGWVSMDRIQDNQRKQKRTPF